MTVQLNNSCMDAVAGSTWVRQLDFTLGNQKPLGDYGWGVEFGICNPDNPAEQYALASIANNKIGWVRAGQILISFAQAETIKWNWKRASWYLDLIDPTIIVDPCGQRTTILRGTMRCQTRG